tara:strand:- start:195 stop:404 length:210 start_codon:yes stop_codon:yes gene_type:complete
MKSIDHALYAITYEMISSIEKGATIPINDKYEIYNYTESNCTVLINRDTEEEEYCVLLSKNRELIFEEL